MMLPWWMRNVTFRPSGWLYSPTEVSRMSQSRESSRKPSSESSFASRPRTASRSSPSVGTRISWVSTFPPSETFASLQRYGPSSMPGGMSLSISGSLGFTPASRADANAAFIAWSACAFSASSCSKSLGSTSRPSLAAFCIANAA